MLTVAAVRRWRQQGTSISAGDVNGSPVRSDTTRQGRTQDPHTPDPHTCRLTAAVPSPAGSQWTIVSYMIGLHSPCSGKPAQQATRHQEHTGSAHTAPPTLYHESTDGRRLVREQAHCAAVPAGAPGPLTMAGRGAVAVFCSALHSSTDYPDHQPHYYYTVFCARHPAVLQLAACFMHAPLLSVADCVATTAHGLCRHDTQQHQPA